MHRAIRRQKLGNNNNRRLTNSRAIGGPGGERMYVNRNLQSIPMMETSTFIRSRSRGCGFSLTAGMLAVAPMLLTQLVHNGWSGIDLLDVTYAAENLEEGVKDGNPSHTRCGGRLNRTGQTVRTLVKFDFVRISTLQVLQPVKSWIIIWKAGGNEMSTNKYECRYYYV